MLRYLTTQGNAEHSKIIHIRIHQIGILKYIYNKFIKIFVLVEDSYCTALEDIIKIHDAFQ